jgi:hypothetical protein
MRLNFNNVKKLRSGHTVWRCLIHNNKRDASVQRIELLGTKYNVYKHHGHLYYGGRVGKNFLNDLHGHGRVACFTKVREAHKYVQEVRAGLRDDEVLKRRSFLQELDDYFIDPHN